MRLPFYYPNAIANASAFGSCSVKFTALPLASLKIIFSAGNVQNIVLVPEDQFIFSSPMVSDTLSAKVTAELKAMLVWLFTVAIVTTPEIPVPLTRCPTVRVPPETLSTVTAVEALTAPFTSAVIFVLLLSRIVVLANVVPDKVYVPMPTSKSVPSEQP